MASSEDTTCSISVPRSCAGVGGAGSAGFAALSSVFSAWASGGVLVFSSEFCAFCFVKTSASSVSRAGKSEECPLVPSNAATWSPSGVRRYTFGSQQSKPRGAGCSAVTKCAAFSLITARDTVRMDRPQCRARVSREICTAWLPFCPASHASDLSTSTPTGPMLWYTLRNHRSAGEIADETSAVVVTGYCCMRSRLICCTAASSLVWAVALESCWDWGYGRNWRYHATRLGPLSALYLRQKVSRCLRPLCFWDPTYMRLSLAFLSLIV